MTFPPSAARERIMVFQQIAFDKNGEVEADYYSDTPVPRNAKTTINGRMLPRDPHASM